MSAKLKIKRGSTESWAGNNDNTTLEPGQLGVEYTASGKAQLKVGDGSATKDWSNLDYIAADPGVFYHNAGAHNSIYRGKCLGSSITDEQWAQISAGTFEDMYIGDYWELPYTWSRGSYTGTAKFRIAAFNYWKHVSTNHVTLVPDCPLHYMAYYSSGDCSSGYKSSNAAQWCYEEGLSGGSIATAIGGSSHILSYSEYLSSSLDSDTGLESGRSYTSGCTIELMNQFQVFGKRITPNKIQPNFEYTIGNAQFPLFALAPQHIVAVTADPYFTQNANWIYWLQDIYSANTASCVCSNGCVGTTNADYVDSGVRPAFSIIA